VGALGIAVADAAVTVTHSPLAAVPLSVEALKRLEPGTYEAAKQ
jgi:hypothetical protein